MASSPGIISDDAPAARAAVAMNHLAEARDGAARLRAFLLQLDDQRAAWAQLEIDGVLTKLSSAMSALHVIISDAAAAAVGRRSAPAGSDGGARPAQQPGSSCGNKRKQSSSRRSQRPSGKKITATLEDGHVWRKYGQKEIQDSPCNPRSYYRCTHKSDQGCSAKRQVQRCDTDTSKYVVTYYGEHTCRDPSTIPLIGHAAALAELDHANNLISFGGPSGTNSNANDAAAAAASNDGGGASLSQYLAMGGSSAAADQLSTSWCTSDDVFSSSAGSFMQVDELISAVVGSAGVVTSVAPDRGGVVSGGGGGGDRGTASFPPSPNSLGFVVGSLGSIGSGEDDDDMFRLDP